MCINISFVFKHRKNYVCIKIVLSFRASLFALVLSLRTAQHLAPRGPAAACSLSFRLEENANYTQRFLCSRQAKDVTTKGAKIRAKGTKELPCHLLVDSVALLCATAAVSLWARTGDYPQDSTKWTMRLVITTKRTSNTPVPQL